MKLNSKVVIVKASAQDELGYFEQENFNAQNEGEVLHVADDVKFCKPGDKVLFFSIKPPVDSLGWLVLDESEIQVNLSGEKSEMPVNLS